MTNTENTRTTHTTVFRFISCLIVFLIFTSILNIVTASTSLAGIWSNFTIKGFVIDLVIGSVLSGLYIVITNRSEKKSAKAETV